jgi:alpha,alpha-trehalose phosphorylase
VADRNPDRARELGIDVEEAADWRDSAHDMHIPYDDMLGVHAQADKFTAHKIWDFAGTAPDQYPLLLHFTYFDLYRKQVVKQADLVFAMFMCGKAFTAEQKARNFNYYEALTVRDSSLSASIQAIMAVEVGQMELAYDYLGEAALIDLHDLEHNTRDGVHIASLAGSWLALVCGFGGMRHQDGRIDFAPSLPEGLARIAFNVHLKSRDLRVEVTRNAARYTLAHGDPLTITHHGTKLKVSTDKPQEQAIPPITPRPRLSQPVGREPTRRRPANEFIASVSATSVSATSVSATSASATS